jgi:high-affinity iron transporter
LTGLLIAFAIGAAFLAVFYTQTTNLYGRTEELWEGIFNLIAVCLITPMSLAILRADRSRNKWRKKLAKAFAGLHASKEGVKSIAHIHHGHQEQSTDSDETPRERADNNDEISPSGSSEEIVSVTPVDNKSADSDKHISEKEPTTPTTEVETTNHVLSSGSPIAADGAQGLFRTLWTVIKRPFTGDAKGATAIFIIPMITTLREGLEGVVFIGGVSLGLPATSIPLPAIIGLFCGLLCGYIVFKAGSFSKVRM